MPSNNVGEITFANGTSFAIPLLRHSNQGGWIYRPPELPDPENPKRKAFGRGWDATQLAKEQVLTYVNNHLSLDYGWPVIESLSLRIMSEAPSHFKYPYLWVSYWTEAWGFVTLQITDDRRQHPNVLRYSIEAHPFVWGYMNQTIQQEHFNSATITASAERNYELRKLDKSKLMIDWMKDPWKETIQMFLEAKHLGTDNGNDVFADAEKLNWLKPTYDIENLPYERSRMVHVVEPGTNYRGEYEDKDRVITRARQGAEYYKPGLIKAVVMSAETAETIKDVMSAFAYFGVEFRITESYSPLVDDGKMVTGFVIELPTTQERGADEQHTIVVADGGVTIECGYMRDDDRYNRYQKRHAAEWLHDFEETLTDMEVHVTPKEERD